MFDGFGGGLRGKEGEGRAWVRRGVDARGRKGIGVRGNPMLSGPPFIPGGGMNLPASNLMFIRAAAHLSASFRHLNASHLKPEKEVPSIWYPCNSRR